MGSMMIESAWVPLSYHLNLLSLLLKVNQLRGQEVKKKEKEICSIIRILSMTHERNIFLTLKAAMTFSKGYFIPMINNSRLTSPRLSGLREPPSQT